MILLSVIIVNYNGSKFLTECIDSIKRNIDFEFEIIVFDNASVDDSVSLLETNYPEINLIKSSKNLGFAKGNNEAVKRSKGKFILLLNNDTILLNNIRNAIAAFDNNLTGIVGIQMKDINHKYRVSAGLLPHFKGLVQFSKLFIRDNNFISGSFEKNVRYEVGWVEGSFLITNREIWDSVSGMDESYFMYCEDTDFCKKVSDLGLKVFYIPDMSYIHFGGWNKSRYLWLVKGFIKYTKKYLNRKIYFIPIILLLYTKLIYAFINLKIKTKVIK